MGDFVSLMGERFVMQEISYVWWEIQRKMVVAGNSLSMWDS